MKRLVNHSQNCFLCSYLLLHYSQFINETREKGQISAKDSNATGFDMTTMWSSYVAWPTFLDLTNFDMLLKQIFIFWFNERYAHIFRRTYFDFGPFDFTL